MRSLRQLDSNSLNALKIALDGQQRFANATDCGPYFGRIVIALLGPTDVDVWGLRQLIYAEDDRRSRNTTVKIASPDAYAGIEQLSERERAVLALIGAGHQAEAIADLLGISYRTVANHKTNISAKLGLGSARLLTKFAIDHLEFL